MCAEVNVKNSTLMPWLLMHYYKLFQIFCILIVQMFTVVQILQIGPLMFEVCIYVSNVFVA